MRERPVQVLWQAAARPGFWLVLMIAVWATLMEPPMLSTGS
jgi:hypothetical protein